MKTKKFGAVLAVATGLLASGLTHGAENVYWGDTHLHTAHSMDAYFFERL